MSLICELFRKENLNNLQFSSVVAFGRACDVKECMISQEENIQIFNIVSMLMKEYPDVISKKSYQKNNIFEIDNCGIGWNHISISYDGNVKSCLMLGEIGYIGNVFNQEISAIFNSNKCHFYMNFAKKREEASCNMCSYKNYCASCLSKIYAANIQRLKDGLELCDIAKRNKMDEYLDFNSNLKFSIIEKD
jgi:radical SAM protein with 4Fe4S-binding SPASM domain